MGGDDLDDGFDLVTVVENFDDDEADQSGDNDQNQKKRKKTADNDKPEEAVFDGATGQWVTASEVLAINKKKRRKQDRNKRSAKFQKKQENLKQQLADGSKGAATVVQQFLNDAFSDSLTKSELDQITLTEDDFIQITKPESDSSKDKDDDDNDKNNDSANTDTTTPPTTTAQLPLADYINDIMRDAEDGLTPCKRTGSPRLVIVCQSAIRAVEVCKLLTTTMQVGKIGKLFGKHKQQSQQAYFLNNNRFSCAVGTPSRIGKLVADGSLKLSHCSRCVFDALYQDSKQRTLFEQPDVKRDLLILLREHLVPNHVKKSKMKMAIY